MKKIVFSVIIMFSFLSVQLVCAQHQISVNIVGEGADDSGKSVSINSDGTYVAIGAPENDGSASNAGHVRVYREFFEAYSQRGGDIDSEAADDQSGFSVSINSDGTIVAIGAPYNDGNGADSGHVRVYEYISSTWTQVGSDIDGEAAGDQSGYSVSINADGTIVAIGALYNDGNGSSSGHVRVYQNQSGTWTQLGGDIDGEASGDLSGRSVSISDDGTIVAIGASGNDDNGSGSGHVRVYQYNSGSNTWSQLGGDINGEAASDSSGASVSINSDGTIVAIGAPFNDGTVGSNRGHVRVYEYSSTSNTWTQVGADIDGEVPDDRFGTSVGINADGKFLVVGAPYNDESTVEAGLVRTYQNVYGTWTRVGANVFGPENGDNTIDYFGTSVGINDKGTVIAAGAPQENDFGNKGYVKMILTMNRWSGSTDNDWNTIGH